MIEHAARQHSANVNTDESSTTRIESRALNIHLWLIALANPDAYASNAKREASAPLHAKNLRGTCRQNSTLSGVDLHRNFKYGWATLPAAPQSVECDAHYGGGDAESEPETQAIMEMLNSTTRFIGAAANRPHHKRQRTMTSASSTKGDTHDTFSGLSVVLRQADARHTSGAPVLTYPFYSPATPPLDTSTVRALQAFVQRGAALASADYDGAVLRGAAWNESTEGWSVGSAHDLVGAATGTLLDTMWHVGVDNSAAFEVYVANADAQRWSGVDVWRDAADQCARLLLAFALELRSPLGAFGQRTHRKHRQRPARALVDGHGNDAFDSDDDNDEQQRDGSAARRGRPRHGGSKRASRAGILASLSDAEPWQIALTIVGVCAGGCLAGMLVFSVVNRLGGNSDQLTPTILERRLGAKGAKAQALIDELLVFEPRESASAARQLKALVGRATKADELKE